MRENERLWRENQQLKKALREAERLIRNLIMQVAQLRKLLGRRRPPRQPDAR